MAPPDPIPLGPHPDPPPDLAERALPRRAIAAPWYRIYQLRYAPLFFGRTRLYRFDAPDDTYGVLYAGEDAHCAFAETFGHSLDNRTVTMADLRLRGLAEITPRRALRLVDLTGAGLARLGADNRLCTGDYAIVQRWSRALCQHSEQPDGIVYRSRLDPSRHVRHCSSAPPICSPSCHTEASRTQRTAHSSHRCSIPTTSACCKGSPES